MAFTWANVVAPPTGDSGWFAGTFANVDEWPASDADELEVRNEFTATPATLDGFDLSNAGGAYKGFKIWVRCRQDAASPTYTGTIRLLEGGTTEIWSSGSMTLPGNTAYKTIVINIPDGSFAGTEDLSNLTVEFAFSRDAGGNQRFRVAWCRLSKSPFTTGEEAELPSDLAGQEFACYRADDLVDLGAVADESIEVWPDASGNGYHAIRIFNSGTLANLHTNDGNYVDFPDGSMTGYAMALGHDVSGGALVKQEWTGNHIHHARHYFYTGGAGGSESRTIYSGPWGDLLDTEGAPGDKSILALDDNGSGDQWVIMSGDGSASAHIHGGSPALNTWYRATQWVQDAGNEHLWLDQDASPTIDSASGSNDFYAAVIGVREDATVARAHEGRISELWFIDGATVTETDIDNARDDTLWGGAGVSISGSLAVTEDADTLAASGHLSYSGSLAETEEADSLAASGTFKISGSLAETEEADTLAASGESVITGTLAETEALDTLAAAGEFTEPSVSGSLAETEEADALAASGVLKYSGSLAETEDADTLDASGATADFVGSLAETEDADTLAASGVLKYSGSLAETEEADSLSASGHLSYSGSLAETEEADTLAASGTVGDVISGSLAETEDVDTLAASGILLYSGSLAEIEEADTLAASGTVTAGISGSLAEFEEADTLAAVGVLVYSGSLAETEEADTLAASGAIPVTGSLAITEEADTLAAVGGFGTPGFVRIEAAAGSVSLVESDGGVITLESAGFVEGV